MLVKAKALGFYGNTRKYPGDVFEMDDSFYKTADGKICKWVEPVQKTSQPQPQASKQKEFKAEKVDYKSKDSSVI